MLLLALMLLLAPGDVPQPRDRIVVRCSCKIVEAQNPRDDDRAWWYLSTWTIVGDKRRGTHRGSYRTLTEATAACDAWLRERARISSVDELRREKR